MELFGRKHVFEMSNLDPNQFDSAALITRLANVVAKEGPLQHTLKIVNKHKNGIDRKELERFTMNCGYAQKLIDQAVYFGLIVQSENVDSNSISLCHLTEKGLKVLKACKNL